jgi:hypothetical protein
MPKQEHIHRPDRALTTHLMNTILLEFARHEITCTPTHKSISGKMLEDVSLCLASVPVPTLICSMKHWSSTTNNHLRPPENHQ